MKKILVRIVFIIACVANCFCLELPKISPTAESIKQAWTAVIKTMLDVSPFTPIFADHNYGRTVDVDKYLNTALVSFQYQNFKNYVATIRQNINKMDMTSLSKNQQVVFENYLNNSDIMQIYHISDAVLPNAIEVTYSNPNIPIIEKNIETLKNNIIIYTQNLEKIQKPEVILQEKREITAEIKRLQLQDSYRNASRIKQLEDYDISLSKSYLNALTNYENNETGLKNAKSQIESYTEDLENIRQAEQRKAELAYKTNLIKQVNNFQVWEDFFAGKNTVITEIINLIDVKQNLINIVEADIPQNKAEEYYKGIDAMLSGWGIF